MFRKIKVPLLGIVENMSHYQCPACGHREHIFGHEGAIRTAESMNMDVLGQVRLFAHHMLSDTAFVVFTNIQGCRHATSRGTAIANTRLSPSQTQTVGLCHKHRIE